MRNETMYRLLVATVFVLLMVIGIYIGIEITGKKEDKNVIASNAENVNIYEEGENVEKEIVDVEEKIIDVDIKYADVYPECGHNINSEEHHTNTSIVKAKEEIANKDIGYKLIGEQEGVLLYQKVHKGVCRNHYKVLLHNNMVEVYRMGENNEFEPYQVTDVTKDMVREGIKEQLETGIIVDNVEDLFLLMEDIES